MEPRKLQPTERAILASAERRFAETGFAGTSVQDVVAGTAFTKPTLYYHFGSKEGLFKALLDYAYDEGYAVMQRAAARGTSVRDKLVGILSGHFEFLRDRRDLTRLAFAAAFAAPGELPKACRDEARWQRNVVLVRRLMAEGRARGELDRRWSAPELARGFLGALSYHLMTHVLHRGVPLNRRTARRIVDLFLQGAGTR